MSTNIKIFEFTKVLQSMGDIISFKGYFTPPTGYSVSVLSVKTWCENHPESARFWYNRLVLHK